MSWRRKPASTQAVRIGRRGILTMPDDMTPDQFEETVLRFRAALRSPRANLIATGPGMTYTPLPTRKQIRLAQTERWLTA